MNSCVWIWWILQVKWYWRSLVVNVICQYADKIFFHLIDKIFMHKAWTLKVLSMWPSRAGLSKLWSGSHLWLLKGFCLAPDDKSRLVKKNKTHWIKKKTEKKQNRKQSMTVEIAFVLIKQQSEAFFSKIFWLFNSRQISFQEMIYCWADKSKTIFLFNLMNFMVQNWTRFSLEAQIKRFGGPLHEIFIWMAVYI